MKKPVTYMVLDYETFSEVDLKKSGAWEYSVHPSTEILCGAFRIGTSEELATAPTKLLLPCGGPDFGEFYKAICNPEIILVAHNALFEQVITRNVYAKRWMYKNTYLQNIPVSRWVCTAALAASVGVPRHLDGAGQALKLTNKKDLEGHRLMLKLCKPRTPSKNDPSTRWDDVDDYSQLYDYCIKDIAAEVELFLMLPPLHRIERKFWELDQTINLRGFAVDRKMVNGALEASALVSDYLTNEIKTASNGKLFSAKQVAKVKAFLKKHGVQLPNLQADTIEESLKRNDLAPMARRILEIRRSSGRSSPAKYEAFELRSRSDGRARDNTLFYGAHTGRQSGTGLQPQNLFKRVIPQAEVDEAVALLRDDPAEITWFPQPVDVLASCIRSAIVAAPGHILDVGDFSTIEVRVLFWLCGHKKGLEAFVAGKDLYIEMAAKIYEQDEKIILEGYKSETVDGLNKRQLGKQTVLGAGFGIGIGGTKFQQTCKSYGIDISIQLAQKAIARYRDLHRPVPHFWEVIEDAARRAMDNPGKAYRHGYLTWKRQGKWLTVQLPIGRKLYYYRPEMQRVRTMYGEKTVLTYMGVNSVTKQFERQKTWGGKLTENVVQAVARDLLMEALLRVEKTTASRPVLAVHDEIVAERKLTAKGDSGAHQAFLDAMAVVPDWCEGLPVKVEGWCADRYRK